jgi:signal transduction histidine kinase/ligand-binding sensor domain-containing protein
MKRRLHRLVVFLAAACLLAGDAAAQPQFDRWTTDNGLPQGSINDILQTRDGYLWLATFGGLVRFDGARFVVFDTDVDGIPSQRIRVLREDSEGTLWAASEDGVLIRRRDGRFTAYGGADGLPHTEALRIDEDAGRNLWITWNGGIVTKFDRTRFVNYRPGDLEHRVAPHPRFFSEAHRRYESKFDVWWSHDSAGLHALVNGQVRTWLPGRDLPQMPGVAAILTNVAGNLLIRTADGRIVQVTNDRASVHEGLQLPDAAPPEIFFTGREGDLWLSANARDLYRFANGQLEKRVTFPQSILSLYVDREGSVWVGTNNGLHRMRNVTVVTRSEREGLSSNMVYSTLRGHDGAVWIGTWGAGLNKLEGERVRPYRHTEGLPTNYIASIHEDRSNRLWVGTSSGVRYLHEGRFRKHEGDAGLLEGNVWAIHEDRLGRHWFATDNGLVKLEGGRFTRYTTADGLSHDRTIVLFEDAAGALWIGTFRGLTRFKDGAFTTFTERDGLVGNHVRAIHEDNDHVLWIGTYDGGLYRLKDGRLTRYTKKQGLYDNGVFQILEDDRGNFWIGCNRGIYRVSRTDLNDFAAGATASITSVVLGAKDGLGSLEVNGGRQPAGMKAPDGQLWFPTMSGVVVIDPKAVRANASAPPVVIEEVRQSGEPVDFAGDVEIPPGSDSFEFRYTAPSFIEPAQIAFRYRLEGLADDWVDAHGARTAIYHRVPPGRYRFNVIAANNDGVWNTTGAGVDLVVLPPLWRTWWFIALASAASTALLWLGYRRRMSRLRREHAVQRAFSRQLIDSLEHERRRISNEMHDSLGQDLSIIRFRARRSSEKPNGDGDARKELEEIGALAEKTSAELKEIAYGLRPYQLDKVGLSRTIEGMIRRVRSSCDIEFDTRIADVDDVIGPDSTIHIYRIVQEAVSNIVKHSKAQRARVTIDRVGSTVEIRVEDDGVGTAIAGGGVLESPATTFGIMGMHERARLAGGSIEVRSTPGAGTSVIATFEHRKRHGQC